LDAALEEQVEIEDGSGAGLLAAAAGEGGQPAAKKQRRTQQQQQQAAAEAAPGVQPCLLTAGAHAAYAGSSSAEEREQLVQQADAMLAAAAGAAGVAGQGAPVPALSGQPASVLRSHWLLRLQLEWEAGAAETLSLPLLAKRRQQRRWVGRWGDLLGCQLCRPAVLCCQLCTSVVCLLLDLTDCITSVLCLPACCAVRSRCCWTAPASSWHSGTGRTGGCRPERQQQPQRLRTRGTYKIERQPLSARVPP
jgi:hypothetical protein